METALFIVQLGAIFYSALLIGRVVASWVNMGDDLPVVNFIVRTTEPVLGPIRNFLPDTGVIDFSPMVALAFVYLAEKLTIMVILKLGQ